MTKFEEEFKALTSWDWVNVDLIQKILTKFGNWHSDEDFQIVEEIGGSFALANKNLIDANTKLTKEIANLKSQIQQQALPVVPEFVGEWYEEHKDDLESSIYRLCIEFNQKVVNTLKTKTKLENWFDYTENKPIETLIRMQEGYEVEKPQLFYLREKNTNYYLNKSRNNGLELVVNPYFDEDNQFTKQEIASMDTGSYELVPVEEGE